MNRNQSVSLPQFCKSTSTQGITKLVTGSVANKKTQTFLVSVSVGVHSKLLNYHVMHNLFLDDLKLGKENANYPGGYHKTDPSALQFYVIRFFPLFSFS